MLSKEKAQKIVDELIEAAKSVENYQIGAEHGYNSVEFCKAFDVAEDNLEQLRDKMIQLLSVL